MEHMKDIKAYCEKEKVHEILRYAEVFYYAGYVEVRGTGTLRMIKCMKEAGLPEPEFKEEYGVFPFVSTRTSIPQRSCKRED